MKYKKDDLFKDLKTGEIIQVNYITCRDYSCSSFDGVYELKNKEVNAYFDLPKEELENEKLYLPLKISEDDVKITDKKLNKLTELSNELMEM